MITVATTRPLFFNLSLLSATWQIHSMSGREKAPFSVKTYDLLFRVDSLQILTTKCVSSSLNCSRMIVPPFYDAHRLELLFCIVDWTWWQIVKGRCQDYCNQTDYYYFKNVLKRTHSLYSRYY